MGGSAPTPMRAPQSHCPPKLTSELLLTVPVMPVICALTGPTRGRLTSSMYDAVHVPMDSPMFNPGNPSGPPNRNHWLNGASAPVPPARRVLVSVANDLGKRTVKRPLVRL